MGDGEAPVANMDVVGDVGFGCEATAAPKTDAAEGLLAEICKNSEGFDDGCSVAGLESEI